jgi:hypothetical protein
MEGNFCIFCNSSIVGALNLLFINGLVSMCKKCTNSNEKQYAKNT